MTLLTISNKLLIVLIIIAVIVLLALAYIYFALIFVGKNDVKVVESLKKQTKVLKPGWHMIVPIRDRVVARIPNNEKMFENSREVSIAGNNDQCYKISYNVSLMVVDPIIFYKNKDNYGEVLENTFTKSLILYFDQKGINEANDFYKYNNADLVTLFNNSCKDYGIEVKDITLTSVSK